MNDTHKPSPVALPISAVERDTGLSKDTLRVWERRYGFPVPVRDANGERAYPATQVDQLRLITRLLNTGLRPGHVVPMPMTELQQLVQADGPMGAADSELEKELEICLGLLKAHQVLNLRRVLHQATLRLGLARFVIELLSPLTIRLGEAWVRGDIQVFEEHMYTECVTSVLRNAITSIPASPAGNRPRILLTTFPQEPHGLGLLMAETLLALEGCECISLGVQTPIMEIVRAALANRVQIVALSFSASLNHKHVTQGLQELRDQLPSGIQIWAGGGHPSLTRRDIEGVVAAPALEGIRALVTAWSGQPGAAPATTHQ